MRILARQLDSGLAGGHVTRHRDHPQVRATARACGKTGPQVVLCDGIVEAERGSMNAPIGRVAEMKYWGVKDGGTLSETKFRVRERFADTTLLELEPVTGRTNQLRIHCEMIGHPIVGDISRGGREFNRLCLHAYKLAFPHPTTRERMEFKSEMPQNFIVSTK